MNVSTSRIPYAELPPHVRAAVEAHTGPALKADSASEGFNSEIAVRLVSQTGEYYVKGRLADHRWAWTQRREAEVNPYVRGIAPTLVARVESGGWDLLVFEAVDGHHADYRPGSSDLPKVVDVLRRLGQRPCPKIELRHAEQRLERHVDRPEDLAHFTGDALLHTDWNNTNVLVSADRVHVVDWGWATKGAPWLDAGFWVIWLVASGHEPAAAEQWAAQVPVWLKAPAEGIDAFAVANANIWDEIGGHDPAPWTARMVDAARRWRDHRKAA
ncbi:aminoglycoside phosphotransferase [Kitasatospora sp. NPDC059463]|uniref:aminoglycoside phosphotransferase n=1 Tax=unclassified Kitasatospora TaxID=2633591 RepID=UPI003696460B